MGSAIDLQFDVWATAGWESKQIAMSKAKSLISILSWFGTPMCFFKNRPAGHFHPRDRATNGSKGVQRLIELLAFFRSHAGEA